MFDPRPDMRVRVLVDVPDYQVSRGEAGVVCSKWNLPWEIYEVEFYCEESGEIKRALLTSQQIEPDELAVHQPDELQPA